MPSTAAEAAAATELQKSIFNAPPGSVPTKPVERVEARPSESDVAHGTKRPREDEEGSDDGEAPMEEDEESDAPMEASSEED